MDEFRREKRKYGDSEILHYKYAECDSTNDLGLRLAAQEAKTIIARSDYQRRGRGTRGRIWKSTAAKNLCLSIALHRPQWTQHFSDYQFLSCLAVLYSLRDHLPHASLRIKYPNDIIARVDDDWKKIAGILVETEIQAQQVLVCVCGIGVNVLDAPIDLDSGRESACSVSQLVAQENQGKTSDLIDMLDANVIDTIEQGICSHFFQIIQHKADDIWADWKTELDIEHLILEHVHSETKYMCQHIERSGIMHIQQDNGEDPRTIDSLREFRLHIKE